MKYDDIIRLLDAGYSREEILNMKEEEPKSADPEPVDPKPDKDDTGEILEELKTLFTEMKKEFTAMNIMNSRQKEDSDVRTADDAIASIINPFKKEG